MAWHARLSASQTKDWFNCPGTIALKEYFPYDDPSGEAARLGTCAHALIERCLEEGSRPADYEGRVIEILHPDTDKEGVSILRKGAKMPTAVGRVVFLVDEDMIEATTTFCDYVRGRLCELFPDQYADADDPTISKDAVTKGLLKLEARTNPLPERDDTGGTADVTIDAWPELLEVADYKNGSGVYVPVQGNYQLRSYTLGRAHEAGFDHERFRYTIGQPRHYLAPPSGVSWEECTPDELRAFEKELRAAAGRVDDARGVLEALFQDRALNQEPEPTIQEAREALFRAGLLSVGTDGSHCTWCRHLTDCPAAKAKVEETAQMDFDDEPHELEEPEGPNHLAVVLPWLDFLEGYAKKARKNAERLLLEGKEVQGYKMVRKQGNRAWVADLDEKAAVKRLTSHYGVDGAKLMTDPVPPKLRTGPQVEKLVGKAKKEEFEKEFLYRPDGGLVMVPESDKRAAVDPTAEASTDFDDLPEE